MVALVAQNADQFSGQSIVQKLDNSFAMRSVGRGDCTLVKAGSDSIEGRLVKGKFVGGVVGHVGHRVASVLLEERVKEDSMVNSVFDNPEDLTAATSNALADIMRQGLTITRAAPAAAEMPSSLKG